jgi:group II intron reverse transcriptase/maturase
VKGERLTVPNFVGKLTAGAAPSPQEMIQGSESRFMIEQITTRKNMLRAMYRVQKNKGSSGLDKLPVKDLPELLAIDRENLIDIVLFGKYLPQPILGVEVPKDNGGKRLLGIPTATDRLLQQAVLQVINARFEFEFSDNSFGFRTGKSLQKAVLKSQSYINSGFKSIVDIDLKSFFDEVGHKLLLQLVYRKVKCKATMRLIRKWLRAPIMVDGKLEKRRKGMPQGSPISPLLSNILLHELDRVLEKKKIRFVRYADDFSIYTKTKSAAKQLGNLIFIFLRDKLKLPINKEKSGIRNPSNFTILGLDFVPTYKKGDKGKYQVVVAKKSWQKFKYKLKKVTRKTTPMSLEERIQKLNQIQRGWVNNYRMASIQLKLEKLDGWVRNRLRYCIWHHWKKPDKKKRSLIRLGIEPGQAYAWSRTRMGGWAVAQSPILITTITLKRLKKRGYVSMSKIYNEISPRLNEPPFTRPVRSVV